MIKKILSTSSYIFISIVLSSSCFFSGVYQIQAAQFNTDKNEENTLGIAIEKSIEEIDNSMTSSEPDLGDDQAFPFIPGFGKNSGKDWYIIKFIKDMKIKL